MADSLASAFRVAPVRRRQARVRPARRLGAARPGSDRDDRFDRTSGSCFQGMGDFGQQFGGDRKAFVAEAGHRHIGGMAPRLAPAPAADPDAKALISPIRSASLPAGSAPVASSSASRARMRSMALRIRVTARGRDVQFAVAEFAQDIFAGMRHRIQARQAEKAAGALDGVHQAENVAQDGGVGGFALEAHQLDIEHGEAFGGFGQEFLKQIVHGRIPWIQALVSIASRRSTSSATSRPWSVR